MGGLPIRSIGLLPLLGRAWNSAARMAREHVPAGPCLVGGKGEGLSARLSRCGFSCAPFVSPASIASVEEGKHISQGGSALVIFFLGLSGETKERRRTLLEAARRAAPFLLLADWRLPERNLDVPAAGLARCLARTDAAYFADGALEGLLHALRNEGSVAARDSGLGGSLGMALLAWKPKVLPYGLAEGLAPISSALSGTTDEPGMVSVSGLNAAQANQNA